MERVKEAQSVLSCKIAESNLHSFFIDFDINDEGTLTQMLNKFVRLLMEEIPSFAFGYHQSASVPQEQILRLLIDAANSIYKIDAYNKVALKYEAGEVIDDDIDDKYLRRGEFGELILHFVLKYFFNTIPLVAKVYFKDSYGHAVHGFDSVHIQPETNTLWLGESKLYTDGKRGVDALIQDLFDHFNASYFDNEFTIISKRIKDTKKELKQEIDNPEYWIKLLNSYTKLSDQLDNIIIPFFCAYETSVFDYFDDEETFTSRYIEEANKLNERFLNKKKTHPWHGKLNVIVILMPLDSKRKLVAALHNKLKTIQSLGG